MTATVHPSSILRTDPADREREYDAFVNDLIYGWVGAGDMDDLHAGIESNLRAAADAPRSGTPRAARARPTPAAAWG